MNMRRRLRLVLPLSMGLLSATLMVWDIHNNRVIESIGMQWDMGGPVWPYQTPEIMFLALNLPASLLSNPINHMYHLMVPKHYIVLFPLSLLWWYLVGVWLDLRVGEKLVPEKSVRFFVSLAVAMCLVLASLRFLLPALRWWRTYGDYRVDSALVFFRLATPAMWCFMLAVAITGQRLLRSRMYKSP